MRRSTATVSLHLEAVYGGARADVAVLLERLAPYGDRVVVYGHDTLRGCVDSSVFQLRLPPGASSPA